MSDRPLIVAQLLASPFYGGPERQVLGLSKALRPEVETYVYSYRESGKATDFLGRCRDAGFEAVELEHNWPHFVRCRNELAKRLRDCGADLLCTNGYKPDILGLMAARKAGIPAVSIAHGWTSATAKVRINEKLDKLAMRRYDRVIGVSEAQSERVRRAGVSPSKVVTIHNGVDPSEIGRANPGDRSRLESYFKHVPKTILVAAGRLSPEKGFDILIKAAATVAPRQLDFGILIFGGGPLEDELRAQIESVGVCDQVVLAGFCDHLDQLLPQADGFVLSSRTEGLPVILLEAMSAAVPSIVTPVGGVGEVVRDGQEGWIVKTENASDLAEKLSRLVDQPDQRLEMGRAAATRISDSFTHKLQAEKFLTMARELLLSKA